MLRTGFHYNVEAHVQISGLDLAILADCARRHYDGRCRKAFERGGFGYGWMIEFLVANESLIDLDLSNITPELGARTHDFYVTFTHLDTCGKILEAAGFAVSQTNLIEKGGQLMLKVFETMREMSDESCRLNKKTG